MSDIKEVLVVEDEPSMQILMRHLLTRAGYNVTIANNGPEAQEYLADNTYDLICSDVMMSGMDGIQLCGWVKEQESLKKIPFVILSSRAQHAEKEIGLKAGADAYLTKPFDINDLMSTLKKVTAEKE